MSKVILLLLFALSTKGFAAVPSLGEVRLLYQKAATEERACKELLQLLAPYSEKNHPLLLGYKAAATMMMAQYAFNPFSKLSYFNKGKRLLENAIGADRGNVELRFLRFGVQANAPSFLGYGDDIATDKAFLLRSLPQLTDADLKKMIVSFLKDSRYLSNDEKDGLRS